MTVVSSLNLGTGSTPGLVNKIVTRDGNGNTNVNNLIAGYTSTATAAGTTTLTVASTEQQYFTGVTTQTVVLPVTSTLVLGQSYIVVNNSSGDVTVNSSGGNLIQVMAADTQLIVTVILTSGTTAASWNSIYSLSGGAGSVIINGDTGSASGSTITLTALDGADNCGGTVKFTASASTVVMNVTDGSNNTFIGLDAGNTTYTGTDNTALGRSALAALTSGNQNVAIGQQCLVANLSGLRNIGVGGGVLLDLQTGNDNIGIGIGTLAHANAANTNIAIGTGALTTAISSTQNIAIGSSSLGVSDGAGQNVAIGQATGGQLLSGTFNTYLGWSSGFLNDGAETANIYLNNNGVSGESNTMRIGDGTGTSTQGLVKTFIAGINGNTVANTLMVTIDSTNDQLGVQAIPSSGLLTWTDEAISFTAAVQNGYFCTAALTATLPAAPTQGQIVDIAVDTAGTVVVQANTGQIIRIGAGVSSTAGTATNLARGDSLQLVYRAANTQWVSIGTEGSWNLA